MVQLSLALFLFAALLSLYSLGCFLVGDPPALLIGLIRMIVATWAVALFVVWITVTSPGPLPLYGVVVFVVAGLVGGCLRLLPHTFNETLPKPVVVLQGFGAMAGYALIFYSCLFLAL